MSGLEKASTCWGSISGWDVLSLLREQTMDGMHAVTWSGGSGDLILCPDVLTGGREETHESLVIGQNQHLQWVIMVKVHPTVQQMFTCQDLHSMPES